MALMWHPVTGGVFDAPDDAVPHYRQSGWLLAAEREEHERRAAQRAAVEKAEQDALAASKPSKPSKPGTEGGA
jgi:hypothetical protein